MPQVLSDWLQSLNDEDADQVIEYFKIVKDSRSEIIDFLIGVKEKIKVRNVAEKYLSAIINDDFSGLDESEVRAVNRWKKKNLVS
jgi:hypothetical protein